MDVLIRTTKAVIERKPAAKTSRVVSDNSLYIVRMKHVTPSDARKNWFRLLDEAAAGEVIVIERNNKRLLLQADKRVKSAKPKRWIQGNVDDADQWGWDWSPKKGLIPIVRK